MYSLSAHKEHSTRILLESLISITKIQNTNLNLCKKWSENTSSGITFTLEGAKTRGYENESGAINCDIAFRSALPSFEYSISLVHIIPNYGNKRIYNPSINVGISIGVSSETQLYIENSSSMNSAVDPKIGLKYASDKSMSLNMGVGLNPVKFGFGLSCSIRSRTKISVATSWHPHLGFRPSTSIEIAG